MIYPQVKQMALCAALATALAGPATAETLAEQLSSYITAFDVTEITDRGRERLNALLNRNDLSHAERVLRIHTILEAEDALRHPDIHGATLSELARAG